jgi:hypothetical protein
LKSVSGYRKITSEMDSMNDMDECPNYDEPIENIEEKLEHLEDLDNETRLEVLYEEINHFVIHGIQPNEKWYQERMYYVQEYQTIHCGDLAARGYQKDDVMYELSFFIVDHIEQLVEEWSTSPVFNLCVYSATSQIHSHRMATICTGIWRNSGQREHSGFDEWNRQYVGIHTHCLGSITYYKLLNITIPANIGII